MVLEVQMQGVGENDTSYPCIIQYILFPPHIASNTTLERDSTSEEDTDEGIYYLKSYLLTEKLKIKIFLILFNTFETNCICLR